MRPLKDVKVVFLGVCTRRVICVERAATSSLISQVVAQEETTIKTLAVLCL